MKEVTALRSTHEEADTRLLLHSKLVVDTVSEAVLLICDDADVFILAVVEIELTIPIFQK